MGKRAKTSLDSIAEWSNLVQAAYRAARGKRFRPEVTAFLADLDRNLAAMRSGILADTVSLGPSSEFHIRDPKPRIIRAPCFRDRVLHHAIMAHVGPELDRALIADTFACRVGKGTLAAVQRCQEHIRRFPWYAKLDIRGYFASIDHAVLKTQLASRFASRRLLRLLGRIIDSHDEGQSKGLPIGALTSQHFANSYLDPCDRFLLETCRVAGVIRYMDDFVFWDTSCVRVKQVVHQVQSFVSCELKLLVKESVQINRSTSGITVCGYRVFPGTIRLAPSRRRRYVEVKERWEALYLDGRINASELQRGIAAAVAITTHADAATWRRREQTRNRSTWDESV